MNDLVADFTHPTHMPFTVIAARLLVAALFGALVGFEREWRNHPAGLRTHMLVALASAAFAILGIEIVHSSQFEADASRLDPLTDYSPRRILLHDLTARETNPDRETARAWACGEP